LTSEHLSLILRVNHSPFRNRRPPEGIMDATPEKRATPSDESRSSVRDTKQLLIDAAKILFAKNGYDGTSVKDISQKAQVNISLVSYHFQGKEGLFRACLQSHGQEHLKIAQKILSPPSSQAEFELRLRLFAEQIVDTHIAEPDVCKILMRECEMQMPVARDLFKETFLKIYETLVHFFHHAQHAGWVREELDAQLTVGLFLGGLLHHTQHDWVNEHFLGHTVRDAEYRKALIETSVSLCLGGCRAKDLNFLAEKRNT